MEPQMLLYSSITCLLLPNTCTININNINTAHQQPLWSSLYLFVKTGISDVPVSCSTWRKLWNVLTYYGRDLYHNVSGKCLPAKHNRLQWCEVLHIKTSWVKWKRGKCAYIQILQAVPAESVFAALAQHLGTALVALDVHSTLGALFDGRVWVHAGLDTVQSKEHTFAYMLKKTGMMRGLSILSLSKRRHG